MWHWRRTLNWGRDRMFGIAIEKVSDLIERVEAFDAGLENTDGTDDVRQECRIDHLEEFEDVLESEDDPAHRELIEFIDTLNLDEQVTLVALAWLGRGTYDRTEWGDALRAARHGHTSHTGDYLVGIPLLGTYLEEGLNQLGLN